MSTPEPRRSARTLKAYERNVRRKMALDVDLNAPPRENLEETAVTVQAPQGRGGSGSSGSVSASQQTQVVPLGRGGSGIGGSASQPPATIDLEAIDDEVVISSPTQFAEASKKNKRNHNSRAPHSSSGRAAARMSLNEYMMRTRVPPNQSIIDCENYVDLESSNHERREATIQFIPPTPPPPKEPTFCCPVCMGPLVEEVSTKCGHIFCKKCIKAAITAQSKCPTCRRKLGMKDTIRIYLPASN